MVSQGLGAKVTVARVGTGGVLKEKYTLDRHLGPRFVPPGGLATGRQYHARISTRNAVGWSLTSAVAVAVPRQPPGAPGAVAVSPLGPGRLRVAVAPPPEGTYTNCLLYARRRSSK